MLPCEMTLSNRPVAKLLQFLAPGKRVLLRGVKCVTRRESMTGRSRKRVEPG